MPNSPYKTRSLDDMGDWFAFHTSQMTEQGLHSKSDIAAELAYRDKRIEELEAAANDKQPNVFSVGDVVMCLGGFKPYVTAGKLGIVKFIDADGDVWAKDVVDPYDDTEWCWGHSSNMLRHATPEEIEAAGLGGEE